MRPATPWSEKTPPEIGDLPEQLVTDGSLNLPVRDNAGIARIELELASHPGQPLVLFGEQRTVAWPARCGQERVTLRAIDLAGNLTERAFDPLTRDDKDHDCDGAQALPDGDDCNDEARWIHPGAPEPAEGFDLDCDGVVAARPGADLDGDGVLSISDGGDDCDDDDPSVHGAALRHRRTSFTVGGAPLTWEPGEAVLGNSAIYLSRGGLLRRFAEGQLTQLASDANERSLHARTGGPLVYGSGHLIKLVNPFDGQVSSSFEAATPGVAVGRLAYLLAYDAQGTEYIAYQLGTQVWLARAPRGGAWSTRFIADAGAPLIAAPELFYSYGTSGGGVTIYLRTAAKVWNVYAGDDGRAGRFEPAQDQLTAAAPSGAGIAVAQRDGLGGKLSLRYAAVPTRELGFPKPITALFHHGSGYLVQLEDQQTFLITERPSLRVSQTLTGLGEVSDAGYELLASAGAGALFRWDGSVFPATDEAGDHIDRNCNGYDY